MLCLNLWSGPSRTDENTELAVRDHHSLFREVILGPPALNDFIQYLDTGCGGRGNEEMYQWTVIKLAVFEI